ncbi:hypothetical protein LV476_04195 [Guyparkeria hydrothermalis]|uniref:hypothetical protein n=1 Tax=Guyparkeria hydrothermalis TaxID=923 RepID=UPI00202053A5|nr:hypothetical protein [Guyparkeria hydrothermalis]MCL7744153.1 hypothetical protein [Guyparkeria hydrothermalis]
MRAAIGSTGIGAAGCRLAGWRGKTVFFGSFFVSYRAVGNPVVVHPGAIFGTFRFFGCPKDEAAS